MLVSIYLSFRHENEDRVISPVVPRSDEPDGAAADGGDGAADVADGPDEPSPEEVSGAG